MKNKITIGSLWKQFLPLSLSDVMMALGDPLVTTTLSHLPDARANLAAVGIAKPIAVFFESPVIMVLHASNALGGRAASRRALWRFVVLAIACLSALLFLLSLPPVFTLFGGKLLGIPADILPRARVVLALMFLWPAASGWRRFYQGLLIRAGFTSDIARASIGRFFAGILILALGYYFGLAGYLVGALGLVGKIVFEAAYITYIARARDITHTADDDSTKNVESLSAVWRFYWPLANSMLVVWGGRALLVGIIARSVDAELSLAAWPAAWGLVLLVANSTRMVQQVVIRNRAEGEALLLRFALSVGGVFSALLVPFCIPGIGDAIVNAFLGGDVALVERVRPVLIVCTPIPLLVALQNATQGFLIGDHRTARVNGAAWAGTFVLLVAASVAVRFGVPGAMAAATAMAASLMTELLLLRYGFSVPVKLPIGVKRRG